MVEAHILNAWFCGEVLPLEAQLIAFIRRRWKDQGEISDIRQEVYEKALIGAGRELPRQTRHYVFAIARNAMINRARRAQIVSFDFVADLDSIETGVDILTPERHVEGREILRRVLLGLDQLPPRCREVVRLRKIEGLSTREVAQRLGVGIDAVEQHMTKGMRALTDFMLGGSGRIDHRRKSEAIKGKAREPS